MSNRVSLSVGIPATILAVVLTCVAPAGAQTKGVVFGIKPSLLPVQTAFIGYSAGRFQPYFGLDLISASLNVTERFGGGEEDKDKFSALVLIPHFGSKLYFNAERSEGTVSPYLLGAIFFSLASVDGGDEASADDEDLVKDILQFWGLNVAFGAEHNFSDRFALGGEFGLRYLRGGATGSGAQEFADEVSIGFAATYAVMTLNFRI